MGFLGDLWRIVGYLFQEAHAESVGICFLPI
jgi:hypothetical protein